MNLRASFISFLTLFLVLISFTSLQAAGKPDVTFHEATFLGGAVTMHIEWQSPNPIVTVRIYIANKEQDVKVDLYDNRRNPSGYAGEVNVTIPLDWTPNQPFDYVIQLEDDLRIKSSLVTGSVKVPSSQQQPDMMLQPQEPSMQIQIPQNIPQPAPEALPQQGGQP
ncbi:MAG: hypothetical protein MIO92_12825 [Methanosarcinaceae archaeon]|nr:hypothetical protein [Methanosarcinaceae archaeon]